MRTSLMTVKITKQAARISAMLALMKSMYSGFMNDAPLAPFMTRK